MTNHWIDLKNTDCAMIIGSNAAENHPMSFKWLTKAKEEKGAKIVNVDPRFTRTSSKSDIYAPIRSGTDIAFIGGMIKWVLDDMTANPGNYNMDYVKQYTNAALIINDSYKGPDDASHPGLFEGYTPSTTSAPGNLGSYNKTTWGYANTTTPNVDTTLENPNCVFQLLKAHYSIYTTDKVSQITGCLTSKLEEVYRTYAATGNKGKAGTILYAMGTTQHTYGTQNIRSYAILQLLLANMGIAGGGINALRGESNVQGSTDMCLLSHILPGYLKVPNETDTDIDAYLGRVEPATVTPAGLDGDKSANWWGNGHYKQYMVSLLKAFYGDNATTPEFGFNYLPKADSKTNYTHIGLFEKLNEGTTIKGMMCWGQNPAVAGPDCGGERNALEKLDWLMCIDLWETETAAFWKRPGANPASIDTEVFLLPAAASFEKEGSISNSGRWVQWRYKAIDPPGDARPDLRVMDELMLKLKEKYSGQTAHNADAINKLAWNYHISGEYADHADPNVVAKEVNGYNMSTGVPLTSFGNLKDDGTTCSGNWIYCGMFDADDNNKAKRHDPVDRSINQIGLYSDWTWCWPINRRIIYNRASVDLNGVPWDKGQPVIWWEYDGPSTKWAGDIPDGGWAPINVAAAGSKYLPFIMKPEGVAHIWGFGRTDGPVPEAYEPWESPMEETIRGVLKAKGGEGFNDPCCYVGKLEKDGESQNEHGSFSDFPCVGTTYRVTEHWQSGPMTRNLPWLVELMPDVFVELGEDLASEKGINRGDKVKVTTARGSIEAVAVVTRRLHRMTIGLNGTQRQIDHVGILWHWGYIGLSKGDSANILTPHVGDANTTIPEYKTFLCKIEKA